MRWTLTAARLSAICLAASGVASCRTAEPAGRDAVTRCDIGSQRGPTMPAMNGVVSATEPPSDRWTVSVGRLDGVVPGGELFVFRGPEYVAMLVVEATDERTAVCRVRPGSQKRRIQPGDECASRL